jgi:hypothetical protein
MLGLEYLDNLRFMYIEIDQIFINFCRKLSFVCRNEVFSNILKSNQKNDSGIDFLVITILNNFGNILLYKINIF